jgi:hypothetical protein
MASQNAPSNRRQAADLDEQDNTLWAMLLEDIDRGADA